MKPQPKYKLTSQITKQLETLAESLPIFQRRDKCGNLMFRQITKFLGVEKNQTKFEKVNEMILVNHKVNLLDIYRHDGQLGVDTYVGFFRDECARQKEEIAQQKDKKVNVEPARILHQNLQ